MNTRKKNTKRHLLIDDDPNDLCELPAPSPKAVQKIHYKFMTRTLRADHTNDLIFKKICSKRLYLKNIIDHREKDFGSEERVYRLFKNTKAFRTLKNIQIPCISRSYISENLKYSRHLKSFTIEPLFDNIIFSHLPRYIKRLPRNIQKINLDCYAHNSVTNKDFYNIAKSLRCLHKLQYFNRHYQMSNPPDRNHVQRELRTYSQSVSRLQNVNRIGYSLGIGEEQSFQRAVRKGIIYPGITELQMCLSVLTFANYLQMTDYLKHEHSIDGDLGFDFNDMNDEEKLSHAIIKSEIRRNDQGKEDDDEKQSKTKFIPDNEDEFADNWFMMIDEDLRAVCQMREDIKPFYRFEVFPNLKKLTLSHEDALYPLDSFVVDGFKSLQKLEDLSIEFMARSIGTGFMFKGLLELPLLRNFSLDIVFIKNDEWEILKNFVKRQDKLESLEIILSCHTSSKARYLQQNELLTSLIKELENKNFLRSLSLKSNGWSLEALSKGLSHLTSTMVNQLHSFSFKGSDDTIFSQEKLWQRIEGLYSFIKKQKRSLRNLEVDLSCALENNVTTFIAEAISTLTRLRKLDFTVNPRSASGMNYVVDYFEKDLQEKEAEDSIQKLKRSEKFNPHLARNFSKLENLEDFSLRFDVFSSEFGLWFVDLLKVLPNLEKLREISIRTNSAELLDGVSSEIVSRVQQEFKNVRKVAISSFKIIESDEQISLGETLNKINEKQALRCDLMF